MVVLDRRGFVHILVVGCVGFDADVLGPLSCDQDEQRGAQDCFAIVAGQLGVGEEGWDG